MSEENPQQWITAEVNEAHVDALATALAVPQPVARVLTARGLQDVDAATRFLNPRLSELSDPFLLSGMEAAVTRIWRAINAESRITVFGDYDADGITSTALLTLLLERLGATVDTYIPSRHEEGYGLTVKATENVLTSQEPELLITVDCGTQSNEAVAWAVERGVDVIVTDHHECAGTPPEDAVAVINPKLGGPDETRLLAGVGVVFKLCHGLIKQGNTDHPEAVEGIDLREYLDLVALGTVADVVPLLDENRTLVRYGLARIKQQPRCGLNALVRAAGVRTNVDCYHLGFLIGPRINAAGRLGSPAPALKLLLSQNPGKAKRLAGQLDAANRERKRIEERIITEANESLKTTFDADSVYGLVAAGDGWNIGTIGIVAARLCGRYKRPAVVISFDENGVGRGSCRSVDSVNMVAALEACSDLLVQFGGHKMAAGLTIKRDQLDTFCERFNTVCKEQAQPEDLVPTQVVDAWITLGEADADLLEAIKRMRPLGLGNPTPTWGARQCRIVGRPRVVGKNHLKMTLASGGSQLDAIAFGMGGRKLYDDAIDVLFHVQENNYMGRNAIQLNIKDFRPSAVIP